MEIASSWKFHSSYDIKSNINNLSFNQCLFSPDGQIFCQCNPSSITFVTKDEVSSIAPPTSSSEEIRCICTAFSTPWILSIGTTEGRVLFYDYSTKRYTVISPDSQPVKFIRVCSFSESHFTKPYPVLLIQYSKGLIAIVHMNNLLHNINSNTPDGITFTKWQLTNNNNLRDSIVINSSIPSPIFHNFLKFPLVYSIGKPFISVSSLVAPQNSAKEAVKQIANKFIKWMLQTEDDDKVAISKTSVQWELDEDKREGISMSADQTGRWIAVVDNLFRVIIIDAIFGHITKVLKGYRDAQIAWISPQKDASSNSFLIAYVPSREIIVVCLVPCGEIAAVVKVVRDGKLFQTIDDKGIYGATFVYPSGDVAVLKLAQIDSAVRSEESQCDSFDSCSFSFPKIISANKHPSIYQLQKTLLSSSWKEEDVKQLASQVPDKICGGYFIRLLLNALEIRPQPSDEGQNENELVLDVVDSISSKLNCKGLIGNSQDFFDANFTSSTVDGENDLAIYKLLSEKWTEYSKFERITVSEESYPQTNLTEKFKGQVENVINGMKDDGAEIPSLRSFLTDPLKYPSFFFAFMRSSDVAVDSIFDSFRISKLNGSDFVMEFLSWIAVAQPAQILLTQQIIYDFLNSKMVRNIALKQYKRFDTSMISPFNIAAISDFLFV